MQKCANLVELEKWYQTHIFLQNFVLIQPRTSPPKICKILLIFPILLTLTPKPLSQVRAAAVAALGDLGARGGEAHADAVAARMLDPAVRASGGLEFAKLATLANLAKLCKIVQLCSERPRAERSW